VHLDEVVVVEEHSLVDDVLRAVEVGEVGEDSPGLHGEGAEATRGTRGATTRASPRGRISI